MRSLSAGRLTIAAVLAIVCISADAVRSQPRRVVRITAERFTFTPSEVVVDAGEEFEVRLKSDDTAHGFRLVGTTVNLVIPKRGRNELVTVVRLTEPGRYTFECSRMCGAGHNFMRGVIVVRDRARQP